MFERELIDVTFVQRWGIVRTLRPQSVAEHTFLVAHYANDIAVYLGLNTGVHLSLLQYALHHDSDEIFTGDMPGPNKRGLLDAIGPEAGQKWKDKLEEWSERTFRNLDARSGGSLMPYDVQTVLLVLKTADWLEAATRMATEAQMGNQCAERHIVPNTNGALETAGRLCEHVYNRKFSGEIPFDLETDGPESKYWGLNSSIEQAVAVARIGQSLGPWITKEDEGRTHKDPCVDAQ